MSLLEALEDYEWNASSRLAAVISAISFLSGIIFSELGVFELILWSILPLLMLLYPWFFVWDVPRKYMFKQAPKEYVHVFAWAGVLYNFGNVIFHI